MKKFLALIVAAMLVVPAVFALSASALTYEDTYSFDEEKNVAVYEVAYGYTFKINYINGTIAGEDATIVTSAEKFAASNPLYAINVALKKIADNKYEVINVIETPLNNDAAALGLDFSNGNIVMIIHSASSNPADKEKYANWQAKVVALALKEGDTVTFDGIALTKDGATTGTVFVDIPEGGNDTTSEPVVDTYEDDIIAAVGEKTEDAKFDLVVDAPETYKAGENVDITVTLKNVTAENGIAIIDFNFNFDADKLENINAVNKDKSLDCVTTLPGGEETAWENLTNSTIENGTIKASIGVADDPEQVAKNDGDVVFTFSFKVKEDATGKIGAWIANESVAGQDAEFTAFGGNGSYDIMVEAEDDGDETTSAPADETSVPADETSAAPTGDNGMNAIVFAIIALVAVAGSAVVIRSRR